MMNYACAFSRSETKKCFEWFINKKITCKGRQEISWRNSDYKTNLTELIRPKRDIRLLCFRDPRKMTTVTSQNVPQKLHPISIWKRTTCQGKKLTKQPLTWSRETQGTSSVKLLCAMEGRTQCAAGKPKRTFQWSLRVSMVSMCCSTVTSYSGGTIKFPLKLNRFNSSSNWFRNHNCKF